MKSRESLIRAFVEALDARALVILAAPTGKPARIASAEDRKLTTVATLVFPKAAHGELVAMRAQSDLQNLGCTIVDGWLDIDATELRDHVVNAASLIGATWWTADALAATAARAVDEILERVEASRQAGGLAEINRRYKIYRAEQLAKNEKAVPYSAHLLAFTKQLVILAAQSAAPSLRAESRT